MYALAEATRVLGARVLLLNDEELELYERAHLRLAELWPMYMEELDRCAQ